MTDKKNKPNVIITPALRRGIIRVCPDYFRMSVSEQEKYRVTMPKDDRFIIWQQLFNDLLNVSVRIPEYPAPHSNNIRHLIPGYPAPFGFAAGERLFLCQLMIVSSTVLISSFPFIFRMDGPSRLSL